MLTMLLLQHKYTLQFTNNLFHSNTDSLYIISPAIHTANHIAIKLVPLASKPFTQVPDNLSDSPDITLQPARDLHFGDQSESSTEHIMSTDVMYATRTPTIPHGYQDVNLSHYTSQEQSNGKYNTQRPHDLSKGTFATYVC